jgi:hypothetical protein
MAIYVCKNEVRKHLLRFPVGREQAISVYYNGVTSRRMCSRNLLVAAQKKCSLRDRSKRKALKQRETIILSP